MGASNKNTFILLPLRFLPLYLSVLILFLSVITFNVGGRLRTFEFENFSYMKSTTEHKRKFSSLVLSLTLAHHHHHHQLVGSFENIYTESHGIIIILSLDYVFLSLAFFFFAPIHLLTDDHLLKMQNQMFIFLFLVFYFSLLIFLCLCLLSKKSSLVYSFFLCF